MTREMVTQNQNDALFIVDLKRRRMTEPNRDGPNIKLNQTDEELMDYIEKDKTPGQKNLQLAGSAGQARLSS